MKVTGLIAEAMKMQTIDEGYRMPKIITENTRIDYTNPTDMPKILYASVWNNSATIDMNSGEILYQKNLDDKWSIEIFLQDSVYDDCSFYNGGSGSTIFMYDLYSHICVRLLYYNQIVIMSKQQQESYRIKSYWISNSSGEIVNEFTYNYPFSNWTISTINNGISVSYEYYFGYNHWVSFDFYPFNINDENIVYYCDYDELIQKSDDVLRLFSIVYGDE